MKYRKQISRTLSKAVWELFLYFGQAKLSVFPEVSSRALFVIPYATG